MKRKFLSACLILFVSVSFLQPAMPVAEAAPMTAIVQFETGELWLPIQGYNASVPTVVLIMSNTIDQTAVVELKVFYTGSTTADQVHLVGMGGGDIYRPFTFPLGSTAFESGNIVTVTLKTNSNQLKVGEKDNVIIHLRTGAFLPLIFTASN